MSYTLCVWKCTNYGAVQSSSKIHKARFYLQNTFSHLISFLLLDSLITNDVLGLHISVLHFTLNSFVISRDAVGLFRNFPFNW